MHLSINKEVLIVTVKKATTILLNFIDKIRTLELILSYKNQSIFIDKYVDYCASLLKYKQLKYNRIFIYQRLIL